MHKNKKKSQIKKKLRRMKEKTIKNQEKIKQEKQNHNI